MIGSAPRFIRSRDTLTDISFHVLQYVFFSFVVCGKVMFCLFVCLLGSLTSSSTTRLYRGRAPRQERLTILRAATHETELGDHDFCLSRSREGNENFISFAERWFLLYHEYFRWAKIPFIFLPASGE